jgi:DNA-binding NarL/FixJ family response regulator
MLLQRAGIHVVGEGADFEAGRRLIRGQRPDVALIDAKLQRDHDGIELAEQMSRLEPSVGILIYTGDQTPSVLARALESGAAGLALKAGPPTELLEAIGIVANGGQYVDPRIVGLLTHLKRPPADARLSPREREVVQLLANGFTGAEIAEQLVLSPDTVRTHIRNAMERCRAQTRSHLIAIALRDGEALPPLRKRREQIECLS